MRPELESIFRTAPIGLAVLDLDLRFVRINERLAEMNGIPVAQHIGRSVRELLPDLADQGEAVMRRVLESGEPVRNIEIQGKTPAQPGVTRTWLEHFSPLRDADGRLVGISVVAEEITQQRQAEQELVRSQERLALAMDAAELVLWDWDIRDDRLHVGADWAAPLGYAPQTAPSSIQAWNALVHPDDRANAGACLQAHLEGRNSVYDCEFRLRAADGGWRWCAVRGRVVDRDAQGHAVRMLGVARDISPEKQAREALEDREQQLRRSQERLEIALEAGRMGVWDWSPNAPEAYWSPETYKLLGKSPEQEAEGASPLALDLVHPDDRPALDAEVARALEKGGQSDIEFRIIRPDGQLRWLLSRGRVVDDRGRLRMIGVHVDITERKLTEEALREADARRTEFLAMLAHELRNPLAPITNAVHLLEKAGETPERRDAAIQILKRQTSQMARLVDDLLEASRITQGRIELRKEHVHVAGPIYQAVEAVRQRVRERGQRLTVEVAASLEVAADPVRLTQVVSNLLTNAVKYTPDGGAIHVAARACDERWLEIEVRDNGMGIDHALLPRIFDLFTQDERTLDRSEGGLGIGLAVVKRLTELHGGSARVDSAGPGKGATFTVRLPRADRREQPRGAPPPPTRAPVTPLSMLVVDDNRDAADSLATLLRLDGHRVDVAHDGEQALAAARSMVPAVVMLDLELPKIDGISVARQLRADPRLRQSVFIATSGYARDADRDATADAGFDAHLVKPVDLAELYRVIDERLKAGGAV